MYIVTHKRNRFFRSVVAGNENGVEEKMIMRKTRNLCQQLHKLTNSLTNNKFEKFDMARELSRILFPCSFSLSASSADKPNN